MCEQLKIDHERGIAEIVASDEVTIEQMKASQKQLATAVAQRPLKGLLYDGRCITVAPSGDDLFDFAKKTVNRGDLRTMRYAMLTSQESALPYMYLALPIAQRGHFVKVFADRQTALEWLGDGHLENNDDTEDDNQMS